MNLIFKILIGLLSASLIASNVQSQTWPADRPIKIVVPYPPGGGTDVVTRVVAQYLGPRISRAVIVENIPGAGGNIGAYQVVRAAPDGHTLLLAAAPLTTNPSLYKNIPFDVLKDLVPITMVTRQQFVLVVHPSVPANSVSELVMLAKSKPGFLTFGSHSPGGATHLAGELFKIMADIDLLHVPYKGQAPALADLLAGRVSMMFDNASSGITHAGTGKLRALATTGQTRSKVVAQGQLPTMSEFKGMDSFNVISWYGFMAPAGTPDSIIERLASEINYVMRLPEVISRLNQLGFDVTSSSPKEFSGYVHSEVTQWAKVIKDANVKLE